MIHQHFIYVKIRGPSDIRLLPVSISILEDNFMWFMSNISELLPDLCKLLASRINEVEALVDDLGHQFRYSQSAKSYAGFTIVGTKCSHSSFSRVVTFDGAGPASCPCSTTFVLKLWIFPLDPANPYAALPIDA